MLAALVVVGTGALPALIAPAPAVAAGCSGSTGVTAVVDFNQLGGGVSAGCAPDGHGDVASRVFDEAGYTQTAHPEMPGFVCRVENKPAAGEPCAEEDAFWSLWYSDGTSGKWVFSQRGAGSLRLRDGWYVAWSWHQGSGDAEPPTVNPTPHASTPAPGSGSGGSAGSGGGASGADTSGRTGERGATGRGSGGSGTGDSGAGATAGATPTPSPSGTTSADPGGESSSPSGTPEAEAKRRRAEKVSAAPSTGAPTEAPAGSAGSDVPEIDEIDAGPEDVGADDDSDGGLSATTVVALVLGLLVLAAAGAVPLLRRRRG